MNPILACIPQDPEAINRIEEGVRRGGIHDYVLKPYTGSVSHVCCQCNAKVWVGPRQQTLMLTAPVVCLECAAKIQGGILANMGNQEHVENA